MIFVTPSRSREGPIWIVLLLLFACRLASSQSAPVPARSIPLLLPSAIAYDGAGNLYIAETQGNIIRRVDLQGNITGFAGDGSQGSAGDSGPAINAQLNSPQGLAIDGAGNVYIADSGNSRIRRVDASTAVITTVAGAGRSGFSGDGGRATAASFDHPRAICLDAPGQNLYIADSRNHRIRHVDLASGKIDTVAGDGTQGFSGDGSIATSASLDSPDSIALDGSGNLYLADTHNARVRRVAVATKIITTLAGTGAPAPATLGGSATVSALALPRGLTADAQGNLFISDSGNNRVLRLDATSGALTVIAGTAVQGFAGDGGAAVAASLNSPRALTLSPGGLVSIADTGNQRVRQLVPASASPPLIQTIAGLGVAVPGALSLFVPTVTAYGSGTLIASFNTSLPATGQVTFLDVGDNATAVVGTGTLVGNSASLSLSSLPAGQHRLMATYPGDAVHASAQTPISVLTISPLPITSTPAPVPMPYGSSLPTLGGSVVGLLAQDASRVTAIYSSQATSTSPVGIYPISTTLSGAGAANYTLQANPASLTITQANTATFLQNGSADGSFNGLLLLRVSSATSGTPSGSTTLLDNGTALQTATLSATGLATFSPLGLSTGTHLLSATYSGDSNFLPSSSSVITESVAPPSTAGFSIATTGSSSQLLPSGASVNYPLAVQVTGNLSSPIALAVTGLPPFTRAYFNPSYVPPGATGTTPVTMTVVSGATSAMAAPGHPRHPSSLPLLSLSLPLCAFFAGRELRCKPAYRIISTLLVTACASVALVGCGDRVNTGTRTSAPVQSYTLTITGTATDAKGAAISSSATVVLQMNAAQ